MTATPVLLPEVPIPRLVVGAFSYGCSCDQRMLRAQTVLIKSADSCVVDNGVRTIGRFGRPALC
jgi:hypothetical protein